MKRRLILRIALVLLAMLPFAAASAASNPDIPDGAVRFNGHSYYLYTRKGSWSEAKKACEKLGGHLVTITSEAENNVVWKLAKKPGAVWIGITDLDGDSHWDWVTGEPVVYSNWIDPVYGEQVWDSEWGCLYYHSTFDGADVYGVWSMGYSNIPLAYVCEWDSLPTTVSAPQNVRADQPAAGTVRLIWSPGQNVKKYVVWRKAGGESEYKKIGETKKLTYLYKDKTVKVGETYSYKVQAVNGNKSAWSSAVKAYPFAKPTGVKVKVSGKTNVVLSWKKVKGAKHYFIYQKGPKDSEFTKLTETKSTKVTLPITTYFGKYQYYVVPAHGSFEGLKSSAVSVKIDNPVVYRAVLVGQIKSGGAWYADTPGCDADRRAMASMLANLDATKYEVYSVVSGSKSEILSAMDRTFGQADEDDVNLFFYSGHGAEGGFFNPGEVTGALVCNGGGTISPQELRNQCNQYKGKKLMIINSCHSGNMIGKGNSLPDDPEIAQKINSSFIQAFATSTAKADDNLAAEGYYVITSCRKDQTSTHYPTHTVFAYTFLEGLGWDVINNNGPYNLKADTNGDNKVSLQEAYLYCHNHIDSSKMDVQVYPSNCSEVFFAR